MRVESAVSGLSFEGLTVKGQACIIFAVGINGDDEIGSDYLDYLIYKMGESF